MSAPPPPQRPTGPPPGADLSSDLGAALTFAGSAMLRNPVAFLVAGVVYSLVNVLLLTAGTIVSVVVTFPQMQEAANSDVPPLGVLAVMYGIIFAAMLLCLPFALLWQTGSGRAGGIVLDGGRPGIGQAMAGPMRIFLTALLVMVLTAVGYVLLVIPGLIVSVLLLYAVPAAVRGASPGAAVKESFSLAKNNVGASIVLFLVLSVIATIAGGLLAPMLVLTPFVVLAQLGMYERLRGRALPEPARS